MKNLKGIAYFDLDGTLLNAHGKVTEEIRNAMEELKQNSILPVICTGRPPVDVWPIAKAAGIDSFIAMNGMFIQVEGKVVYTETIDRNIISALLTYARKHDGFLFEYSGEEVYTTDESDIGDFYNTPPILDENIHMKKPINMLIVISHDKAMDERYRTRFPGLNFFRNAPFAIDVLAAGVDKGTGTVKLAETIGAAKVPTYAFGDGENDFHMLSEVTHGIAMGNAIPMVKEIADFVTTKNTDHGIVNGLRHYGLIK